MGIIPRRYKNSGVQVAVFKLSDDRFRLFFDDGDVHMRITVEKIIDKQRYQIGRQGGNDT